MQDANNLAQRIAEFIKHNNIDVSVVAMDTIVREFFRVQTELIEDAGIVALGFFGQKNL